MGPTSDSQTLCGLNYRSWSCHAPKQVCAHTGTKIQYRNFCKNAYFGIFWRLSGTQKGHCEKMSLDMRDGSLKRFTNTLGSKLPALIISRSKPSMCTQAHNFNAEISAKTPILAYFGLTKTTAWFFQNLSCGLEMLKTIQKAFPKTRKVQRNIFNNSIIV